MRLGWGKITHQRMMPSYDLNKDEHWKPFLAALLSWILWVQLHVHPVDAHVYGLMLPAKDRRDTALTAYAAYGREVPGDIQVPLSLLFR